MRREPGRAIFIVAPPLRRSWAPKPRRLQPSVHPPVRGLRLFRAASFQLACPAEIVLVSHASLTAPRWHARAQLEVVVASWPRAPATGQEMPDDDREFARVVIPEQFSPGQVR
jgi:hypothetical protein